MMAARAAGEAVRTEARWDELCLGGRYYSPSAAWKAVGSPFEVIGKDDPTSAIRTMFFRTDLCESVSMEVSK